uniref:Uncharacterized protein n=2 Tax=Schistosoma japonicum TaxID=6182 RepID=Q5C438_SCHJA|nr:unknown [Schistosoma japonicum]
MILINGSTDLLNCLASAPIFLILLTLVFVIRLTDDTIRCAIWNVAFLYKFSTKMKVLNTERSQFLNHGVHLLILLMI